MRAVRVLAMQVILSVLFAGLIMPGVLFAFPAARERHVGQAVVLGAVAAVFVVVRLVWSKPAGR